MSNSKKTIVWVIAEFVLVFVLLSLPGNEFPDQTSWISKIMSLPFADKIVHMGLFGSLALSIFVHFEVHTDASYKSNRVKAIALIVCILYGIGMEYYQKYFVPNRGFEILDMLADAIGALCALPVFKLLGERFFK
ncbi:MAG: VanZ family protein [Sediminibacterium sp.]|jgi:VanZ family protein